MRSLVRRGVRLELVAGLGLISALALAAVPAMAAEPAATATRLTADTRVVNNRTEDVFSVSVSGLDGQPARGAVVFEDAGKPLGGAALDVNGRAELTVDLAGGTHSVRAVYQGDEAHAASVSEVTAVAADSSTSTPDFQVSVNPASLTLTQGQSGSAVVSLTPINASALAAPMFVTLACSGLPDQSSCSFTPENVQIQQGATAAVTSDMVLTTQAKPTHGQMVAPATSKGGNPVAWAVLLPGAFGLAGLAFAFRRNQWLSRLTLMALVAFVGVLGTTGCNPRYNYFNHGPPYNLPTPAGTYTMKVTAQSSNGVTATTHSAQLVLTVKAAS